MENLGAKFNLLHKLINVKRYCLIKVSECELKVDDRVNWLTVEGGEGLVVTFGSAVVESPAAFAVKHSRINKFITRRCTKPGDYHSSIFVGRFFCDMCITLSLGSSFIPSAASWQFSFRLFSFHSPSHHHHSLHPSLPLSSTLNSRHMHTFSRSPSHHRSSSTHRTSSCFGTAQRFFYFSFSINSFYFRVCRTKMTV